MPVEAQIEHGEGTVRVALTGELDIAAAPVVEERLAAIGGGRTPSRVVVDLRGLAFMDSTGLSLLLNAHKRVVDAGGRFTLVAGTGPVRRILDATGLAGRLDIVDEPPAEDGAFVRPD